jgi:hypothetical protein
VGLGRGEEILPKKSSTGYSQTEGIFRNKKRTRQSYWDSNVVLALGFVNTRGSWLVVRVYIYGIYAFHTT